MGKKAIVPSNNDNVATAIKDLEKGEQVKVVVEENEIIITLKDVVAFGHKFSITDIAKGDGVIKYGEVLGEATQKITSGEHVHVHNLVSKRGRGDLGKGDK